MPGVCLSYCHSGDVTGPFHEAVVGLLFWDAEHDKHILGPTGAHVAITAGPRIASARNEIVRGFLRHASTPEWLLMLDTDMVFTPDLLDRLLEAADKDERPVVGGLCFAGGRSGKVFPTLYAFKPQGDSVTIEHVEDWPEGSLVKVDGTGTACLLIHRSVFEKMARRFPGGYPWFTETELNGREVGEDIGFCMRLNRLDIPVYVHTGVVLGHIKPMVIDEQDWHTYKANRAEHGEAALLHHAQRRLRRFVSQPAPQPPKATRVPTYVVIPVKDRLDLTQSILAQLEEQGGYHQVFVFDNGSGQETKDWLKHQKVATVFTRPDASIAQMWNEGIRKARRHKGPVNVAILNNDLKLGPNMLKGMSEALRSDPSLAAVCPNYDGREVEGVQYVQGTAKTGGMAGFAFMLKGELFDELNMPLVDEALRFWWGDDDLVQSIVSRGWKVGVCEATVEHVDGGSNSWEADEEHNRLIKEDAAYHWAKHRVL